MKTRKLTLMAMLTAIALTIFMIEAQIPALVPIPGIKLGLSNGILIFAVYMLGIPTAFVLMVLKVVLSGLMFGGVSAMMYAFAGGLLSMIFMSLLSRMKGIHVVVVSMIGGLMHNVGQVGLAMVMLSTPKLLYYMAILMVVGLGCGALTGICADSVMKHLRKMRK